MEDGPYYATVQALNNIVYGGALVTTVCKSTPIMVDTTPPIFDGVTEIFYDEDFDLLGVYFKAYDLLSNLSRVDFGLGKTKHDVLVRGYSEHVYVDRKDPYVVIEELGLQEGVPAWIRLRAVNNGRYIVFAIDIYSVFNVSWSVTDFSLFLLSFCMIEISTKINLKNTPYMDSLYWYRFVSCQKSCYLTIFAIYMFLAIIQKTIPKTRGKRYLYIALPMCRYPTHSNSFINGFSDVSIC